MFLVIPWQSLICFCSNLTLFSIMKRLIPLTGQYLKTFANPVCSKNGEVGRVGCFQFPKLRFGGLPSSIELWTLHQFQE